MGSKSDRIRQVSAGFHFRTALVWSLLLAIPLGPLGLAAQMAPPVSRPADTASIFSEAPVSAHLVEQEATVRQQLRVHPDSAPLLYELGLLLKQENKPRESLETFTRAAKIQKPDANQLRWVAQDYVLLNDYQDAIHWLEAASHMDPENVEVLYSLGRCLYTQGHFSDAVAMYLRVLGIQPDHLKAQENLGVAYDAENQPDLAEAAMRTAVVWAEKKPADEWPFLNLGSFLLDHDRASEAVPLLRRAASISPKSSACHEKLGRALDRVGSSSDGAAELEIAAQLDPKNPNVYFELGHAYRQAGNLEKARAAFATSQQLRKERDQR
jgi:Flp pilus assembly protein TadD